ncbi:MAG: carotenoid biosynthesis protein [Acidobacteria bacterium]|nr:carotenoid biosynthesis protein [Acidobacteriota bacterium]
MSIRQYRPRRQTRGTITQARQSILISVFSIALLLQISYPLVSGETLRLITIATVYWAAGAMALHSLYSYGLNYALRYITITFVFALVVEQIGSRTGWPFGTYSYDNSLGYQIYGVPLVVPFAWMMLAHPLLIAARRVSPHWVFLYGGAGLMAWDIFLDPQMVSARRWTWEVTGRNVPFQPDVPLSNTFGWLLTGMGLMALLQFALPRERRKNGASLLIPNIFLGWTWFAGVVGNIFFFARPGVAFLGGIVFGLILLPYFIALSFGRSG